MKHAATIVIEILILTAANAFGQAKEITKSEYDAAKERGYAATDAVFPRRWTYVTDGDGIEDKETTITELFAADRTRTSTVHVTPTHTDRSEMIRIGKVYYCRENGGEWTELDRFCGPFHVAELTNNNAVEKFTVENVTENRRQGRLFRYVRKDFYRDVAGKPYGDFTEQRFWIDKTGRLVKYETVAIYPSDNKVKFRGTTTYEFKVKLAPLVAPIK